MKRFKCPNCLNEVHFESRACVVCGQSLGIRTDDMRMIALSGPSADNTLSICRNADSVGCNWMAPSGADYCSACQHNHIVPDLGVPGNHESWTALELGKRKLIYALLAWRLPHPTRAEDPSWGLAFDFMAESQNPDGTINHVGTGHQNGTITLNLAEGHEVERVERKHDLREPYRTVIGHLRHEIGHYYWMRLVERSHHLDTFRTLFGDETRDYGEALRLHYATGPLRGWQQSHISSYAASHPWEDFAETWAHWMHIVDGLETAQAFGINLRPDLSEGATTNIYRTSDVSPLVEQWVPLTVAINSMNRGMGQPDLYPFVLSRPVIDKMSFINRLIQDSVE